MFFGVLFRKYSGTGRRLTGNLSLQNWKRRWFVLRSGDGVYYYSKQARRDLFEPCYSLLKANSAFDAYGFNFNA